MAELLIALAILGILATFTIPKVLQSQQDTRFKAIAKETASMISGAYEEHRRKVGLSPSNSSADLTPYLNYASKDTSPANCTFDWHPNSGETPANCSTYPYAANILRLHNGALLFTDPNGFGGTGTTNVVWFMVDPDGKYTGKEDSIWFMLYYNGRITSWGSCFPGTTDSTGVWPCPDPNKDPAWFSWD